MSETDKDLVRPNHTPEIPPISKCLSELPNTIWVDSLISPDITEDEIKNITDKAFNLVATHQAHVLPYDPSLKKEKEPSLCWSLAIGTIMKNILWHDSKKIPAYTLLKLITEVKAYYVEQRTKENLLYLLNYILEQENLSSSTLIDLASMFIELERTSYSLIAQKLFSHPNFPIEAFYPLSMGAPLSMRKTLVSQENCPVEVAISVALLNGKESK